LNRLRSSGGVDRLDRRADQLHAELGEHPGLVELDREVERGLAARASAAARRDVSRSMIRRRLADVERLDVGRVGEGPGRS